VTPFRRELRAGWRNLLAATIGLGLGIPSYTPVSSLFLRALELEFGWSKTVAAGAMIALPVTALILPFAGALIDRFGVRLISAVSVAGTVVSYIWLSRLSGRTDEYYAATIALNVLGCATGPVAYTRLVATQFNKTRGTALAIAQFGIAALAVAFPLVISAVMATRGWRGCYLLLAASTLLGGACAQILMRPGQQGADTALSATVKRQSLARQGGFWQLGFAVLAISIGSLGLVSQLQSVLLDRGLDATTATRMLSLLAASVMLSRLFVGRLLDLWDPNRCTTSVYVAAAIGAGSLAASNGGVAMTAGSIVLIGLSVGAELDVMSFFCARLFGTRHYARNYGLLCIFLYTGIAAGSIGFGAVHDKTGSYSIALTGTTALLLAAATLFWSLPRPATSPQVQASGPFFQEHS
jgi:predicted MFS family arabinose efflux permease